MSVMLRKGATFVIKENVRLASFDSEGPGLLISLILQSHLSKKIGLDLSHVILH